MIKAMIVDDHDLIRSAISALLSDAPNIEVIGTANSGEEAILIATKYQPDVILMDIRMPGIGGVFATQKIIAKHPNIKIIALTSHTEALFAVHMLEAGAQGYLTKGATIEKILQAIQAVIEGKKFLDTTIAQTLALRHVSGTALSPFEKLSLREFDVVMMLSQGINPQTIAQKLFLSIKTINAHRYRIFEKLNVKTDVEVMLLAKKEGIIEWK